MVPSCWRMMQDTFRRALVLPAILTLMAAFKDTCSLTPEESLIPSSGTNFKPRKYSRRPEPAPPKSCIRGTDHFADGSKNLSGRARLGQQGERRIFHCLFHDFTT